MDSSLQSQSPDNSDVKPSFRKPVNDSTNRKYRRRSPISGSPSSSSGGSPKHGRNRSPNYSKEESIRTSNDRWRRKDDKMDLDRDSGRIRSGKGSDSYKHSERQSYRSSRDYSRHDRHADDEERGYQRSSRSGRESRGSTYSDHVRKESDYDRSRENWRNNERYPRDRSDDWSHRNKDKERETAVPEHHRHNDKDFSDRTSSGMRQGNSNMDEIKMSERERTRDGGGRDDKRDHRRSMGDYKYENASSQQEFRGHEKDLTSGRDSGATRSKESHRSSNKEPDRPKEDMTQKRKHDDRDNNSSSTYRERDAGNDKSIRVKEDHDSSAKNLKSFHSDKAVDYADDGQLSKSSPFAVADKPPSSSHQVQENVAKSASANEIEASNDLNAAKVAAMKAAELVNRNLVGGGYMSTDQKRKLLWGNKKNTAAEESGNLWGGMPLFSDRERQEKFNKLMSLRLPWYLWPIVGCERRFKTCAPARRQRRQQSTPSRAAGAAPAGFGEAIHCWAPPKRWSYSWTWPVIIAEYLHSLLTIFSDILVCNLLSLWLDSCMNNTLLNLCIMILLQVRFCSPVKGNQILILPGLTMHYRFHP